MIKILRTQIWPAFLDIIFPECCLGCGVLLAGRQYLAFCHTCVVDVQYLKPPLCLCCGKPFNKAAGENHYCGQCLARPFYFKQARAAVKYQEPIAKAVRQFKYGNKMSGVSTFANLMHKYSQFYQLLQMDTIIPVPLHKKRLQQRGFNQALVLARKFFPDKRRMIEPLAIERFVPTIPQTGLSRTARQQNVKNAFQVRQPEKIADKKILLIDDVFTTGATVNECARILLGNGAREVHVLTLARAIE
jgi:ComF family protein